MLTFEVVWKMNDLGKIVAILSHVKASSSEYVKNA